MKQLTQEQTEQGPEQIVGLQNQLVDLQKKYDDLREERDKDLHVMSAQGRTIEELRAECNGRRFDPNLVERLQVMRTCIVYARDRRGGLFDFDEWADMVRHALEDGTVPPHALENAQAKEVQAWEAVKSIRAERDLLKLQVKAPESIAMRLLCPECHVLHIDEKLATKAHHTHACQNCGCVWRPAIVPTVGVRFLPGFKNEQ